MIKSVIIMFTSTTHFAPASTQYGSMQFMLQPEQTMIPIPVVDSYDWSISDVIDVKSFILSRQNKAFARFLRHFVNAKAFTNGTPEQLSHLLHLLQKSLNFFAKDHDKMRKNLDDTSAKLVSLQRENAELRHTRGTQEIYICPVCLDGFQSIQSLDSHITIKHPDLIDEWNKLRRQTVQDKPISTLGTTTIEYAPGTLNFVQTQNSVLDELDSQLSEKLEHESADMRDMQLWLTKRFYEFESVIKASSIQKPRKAKHRKHKPKKKATISPHISIVQNNQTTDTALSTITVPLDTQSGIKSSSSTLSTHNINSSLPPTTLETIYSEDEATAPKPVQQFNIRPNSDSASSRRILTHQSTEYSYEYESDSFVGIQKPPSIHDRKATKRKTMDDSLDNLKS